MNRGEVWEVNLDPSIGAEIRKRRPCVIVNRDTFGRLPLRIIVPLTEWDPRFEIAPWHVPVEKTRSNGLKKKSSADTFQVRSISEKRLIRKLGSVSDEVMQRIEAGLAMCVGIG